MEEDFKKDIKLVDTTLAGKMFPPDEESKKTAKKNKSKTVSGKKVKTAETKKVKAVADKKVKKTETKNK